MYYLSITNLPSPINNVFFNIVEGCRWIYAMSPNEPLLLAFKTKIEAFTPPEYLPFMLIEVFNDISDYDVENNSMNNDRRVPIELDKIYPSGVVNRGRDEIPYSYDEFTRERWGLEYS